VATSTLRSAIIVALVVGGVVLIGRAFDRSPGAFSATSSPTAPASPSTSTGGGGNGNGGNANGGGGPQTGPQQQAAAVLHGVHVAVYNGTFQTGLAADTATKLQNRYGVKIDPQTSILDSPDKPVNPTAVYFVDASDKTAAESLAHAFFRKLSDVTVAPLPSNTSAPAGVQVAVYVGTDYLSA
jgi:hypothetical protein